MRQKLIVGVFTALCLTVGSTWAEDDAGARGRGEGRGPRRGPGPGGEMRPPPREALQDADTNNDCIIDDAEAEAAIKKMGENMKANFKRRNELFLQRFDENKNGVIDGPELEKARAAKETFTENLRERLQNRRGGPGTGPGAKATDAAPDTATP